jgi:hypothetical protein
MCVHFGRQRTPDSHTAAEPCGDGPGRSGPQCLYFRTGRPATDGDAHAQVGRLTLSDVNGGPRHGDPVRFTQQIPLITYR